MMGGEEVEKVGIASERVVGEMREREREERERDRERE